MFGLFGLRDMGAQPLAAQNWGTEGPGKIRPKVDTPAYARQRVLLQTATTIQTPIGQQGTGVTAVSIQQVRDALLDNQIKSETSVTGSLAAQQLALQNAEAGLGEQISGTSATGQDGLSAGLSNLFSAFQALTTAPTSLAQRQVLIQTAQGLATQFNQVSSRLSDVHNALHTSIQNYVTSGNHLLGDIASLNKQIVYAEAAGGTANDLRDLRQQ